LFLVFFDFFFVFNDKLKKFFWIFFIN
jgi:hypothetical protein